jgi:protein tyrosine/serine phosphatase
MPEGESEVHAETPAPRPRRNWRRMFVAGGVLAVVVGLYSFVVNWRGNFWTVVPGRVYRSGRLDDERLEQVIRKYGIRTVVDLRGSDEGIVKDRQRERALCRKLGARYRKVSMSAVRIPRPDQVNLLVETLDDAEYPILVHCRQGADRTGFAAALYRTVYCNAPVRRAQSEELTIFKGHLPFEARAMDRFFDLYAQTSGGRDMRLWISGSYPEVYARATGTALEALSVPVTPDKD